MAETLIDYLKDKEPRGFEARPIYSADGDFITLYLKDEDSYAERVDELLTVYLSVENRSLVGCKIKGVRRLLKTLGDFGVSIDGEDVSVNLLFLAGALHSPANREKYEQLGRQASDLTIPRGTLDLQPA
jgi:hypothetical protein